MLTDSMMQVATDPALADSLVAMKASVAEMKGSTDSVLLTANNIWMLLSTFLVFIMSLGFATLEAGFTQAKNTVNILFKNTVDLSIGVISYALFGFALMYPGDFNGWFGFAGWGLNPGDGYDPLTYASMGYTYWTDYLFQAVFAATSATFSSLTKSFHLLPSPANSHPFSIKISSAVTELTSTEASD